MQIRHKSSPYIVSRTFDWTEIVNFWIDVQSWSERLPMDSEEWRYLLLSLSKGQQSSFLSAVQSPRRPPWEQGPVAVVLLGLDYGWQSDRWADWRVPIHLKSEFLNSQVTAIFWKRKWKVQSLHCHVELTLSFRPHFGRLLLEYCIINKWLHCILFTKMPFWHQIFTIYALLSQKFRHFSRQFLMAKKLLPPTYSLFGCMSVPGFNIVPQSAEGYQNILIMEQETR